MAMILNGKDVAADINRKTKEESAKLRKKGVIPTIGILRVGNKEDDIAYEKGILKNCQSVDVGGKVFELPEDVTMETFFETLETVNNDSNIHGILIFSPLPKQLDESKIKHRINPAKDIDCMNPQNMIEIFEGTMDGFMPCTPAAVMEILKFYNVELNGANTVVIGRSMVVGKPLSMMLLSANSTITICHSKTQNLRAMVSQADIVVAAIGKAKFVGKDFIKPGAVVIDVGINVDDKGNIWGDVHYEEVETVAGKITPVPGGVGSVTTSILLKHVVKAASKLNNFS